MTTTEVELRADRRKWASLNAKEVASVLVLPERYPHHWEDMVGLERIPYRADEWPSWWGPFTEAQAQAIGAVLEHGG